MAATAKLCRWRDVLPNGALGNLVHEGVFIGAIGKHGVLVEDLPQGWVSFAHDPRRFTVEIVGEQEFLLQERMDLDALSFASQYQCFQGGTGAHLTRVLNAERAQCLALGQNFLLRPGFALSINDYYQGGLWLEEFQDSAERNGKPISGKLDGTQVVTIINLSLDDGRPSVGLNLVQIGGLYPGENQACINPGLFFRSFRPAV